MNSQRAHNPRFRLQGSRSSAFRAARSAAVVLLAMVAAWQASAQWVERSYQLNPGWNAIFLDVHPEPAECDTLFAGLPVESVWDFNPTIGSPQFVQDPATLIPGLPNWLTWFPPASPSAGVGNLFILRDGRSYLIKLADNAVPVTWTVSGRPSLRELTWKPGGVNFVGFRVGPTGPTFQSLFAGEAGLAGQPVYLLNSVGSWQQVANLATARPEAGKAYWVRCLLPTQRTATLAIDAGSRLGLTFAGGITEANLRVRNTSSSARSVTLRLLPSATPPLGQPVNAGLIPLEYWKIDFVETNLAWEPFPSSLTFSSLPAGAEWNLRLGVRRAAGGNAPPGSLYQGLLEATDDLGTRWLLPLNAEPGAQIGGTANLTAALSGHEAPFAGLWVGSAIVNTVSEPAHPTNADLPRPAGGDFAFRLILHVDAAGTTRLLQKVFLVRKPPTYMPDSQNPGFNIVDQPARTLVLTDETLIDSLVGAGEIVGQRISSPAFSFVEPLTLAGGPFGASVLTGLITLDYDDARNPFKHVYHPDHDNLDGSFNPTLLPEGRESFTIDRAIAFEFTTEDPSGLNPPGWGDSELGGIYRETIDGLHRSTLHLAGTFRLVRVAGVAELDDEPFSGLSTASAASR